MNFSTLGNSILVVIFTILSGYFDSRGFLFASKIMNNKNIVPSSILKSFLGFFLGIVFYWFVIFFLHKLKIASSPEIQTLGWFSITMIALSISSGEFASWDIFDKFVSLLILFGIGFLVFRGH